ncbi:hypothetical protein EH31_11610 [Erythrobacter longus]|uniref:Uncharacterized protein n=1 Tax=Erythrobacter longus TaxID=1044 RepID=A0A074MW07_ERYLO|nr:hypothetical protein EH31_11610 [Erythrobacter longus]
MLDGRFQWRALWTENSHAVAAAMLLFDDQVLPYSAPFFVIHKVTLARNLASRKTDIGAS